MLDKTTLAFAATVIALNWASVGHTGIEQTPHNFITGGAASTNARQPGLRVGPCVFCHTPHSANPAGGLWNRALPGTSYRLYESSTLEADLGQPTGSSRMCLSCHDGTLALSDMRVVPPAARGFRRTLRGAAALGTDLSADHPISFVYNTGLSVRRAELVDPSSLPHEVRLDETGQLQCTTCHDAHDDPYGDFLVMENRGSRLCTTCHRIGGWQASAHANSTATDRRGVQPWPHTEFTTVADNGCQNCHKQHGAEHPEWLLAADTEAELCLTCHSGAVAEGADLSQSFLSFSMHAVQTTADIHTPNEDPALMDRHVTCGDCHDPHTVRSSPLGSRGRMATLGSPPGLSASGTAVTTATTESEVCYRCHGIADAAVWVLTRDDNLTNIGLEISVENESFHPVESTGRNPDVPGLEAGYTTSSKITCSDCHGSDRGAVGGARGPHGSAYEPILAREYQMVDPSMESARSYDLCYQCHNREVLLRDVGGFPHRLHVVESETSCAVCHDAHGSRNRPFLVNFAVAGNAGDSIVTPSSNGKLDFDSFGSGSGQCFLECHGVDHDPFEYPAAQRLPSNRATGFSLPLR